MRSTQVQKETWVPPVNNRCEARGEGSPGVGRPKVTPTSPLPAAPRMSLPFFRVAGIDARP